MIFLPFQGTFFFNRGGAGAGEGAGDGTAGVAGSIAARHGNVSLGGRGGAFSSDGDEVSIAISAPDLVSSFVVDIFGPTKSEKCSCFKVSVLCWRLCATRADTLRPLSLASKNLFRVGVLGSMS